MNVPSVKPSLYPSVSPSFRPSVTPTRPTVSPTLPVPSISPSPTVEPSVSFIPTASPSDAPSAAPSEHPIAPSAAPTWSPTALPSATPTLTPSMIPSTQVPTAVPSTVEFVVSHPKAIPTNQSISVTGLESHSFKIVLPFLSMSSGSYGTPFEDIVLSPGNSGIAYLLSGSTLVSGASVSSGVAYSGSVGVDTSKRSVSVLPDINGDGADDLIIGDPYAAKCYAMFGSLVNGLMDMATGFTVFGEQSSDMTGWSVSGAGDVNNDMLNDFIIGAPAFQGVGALYVVYGRKFNNFDVYLNNLTASQGFAVYGGRRSDYLGISVSSAGDVNKDGYDDVVAGAVKTSLYFAGAAYVLFGARSVQSYTLTDLSSAQGIALSGVGYMYVGYSVSGCGDVNGDVNCDGYDDILIGSNPQKSSLSPMAFVVFGSSDLTSLSLTTMTAAQGVSIRGGGIVVSGLDDDDTDTDGLSDVLVGGSFTAVTDTGYVVFTDMSQFIRITGKPSCNCETHYSSTYYRN